MYDGRYIFNKVIQNPGHIGSAGKPRLAFGAREQWSSVDKAPKTNLIALDFPLTYKNDKRLNLGFYVISDKLAAEDNTNMTIGIRYGFPFIKGKLAFGVNGGLITHKINWENIDCIDTELLSGTGKKTGIIGINAGFMFKSDVFFLDAAISNLNQP